MKNWERNGKNYTYKQTHTHKHNNTERERVMIGDFVSKHDDKEDTHTIGGTETRQRQRVKET